MLWLTCPGLYYFSMQVQYHVIDDVPGGGGREGDAEKRLLKIANVHGVFAIFPGAVCNTGTVLLCISFTLRNS